MSASGRKSSFGNADVHAVWPKVSHLRPKVRYLVDELVKLCSHRQ